MDERAAVPDVRDGLTIAARCTLQALHAAGTRDRAYVKSSRIVAAALRGCPPDAASEPDAGAALYDELVRMAQDFSTRYPLVDGRGNLGSVDDEPAADMRYTEARLDHAGAALLADLDRGAATPPPVLPASFPNLLVNGAFGSSAGALTRIAPHNLREIAAATIAVIEDPAIDVAGLMAHLPGPDFPTGGILLGRDGIAAAYATGRGRVWLRGRAHYESVPRGRQALVVTHLPYGVTKGGELGFISEVARLVDEQRISGIADLEDHTSEQSMRIVITLRRDADPTDLLHELHERSQMQTTFLMKIVAVVDGAPRTLTLKEALARWLEHRREVVARRRAAATGGGSGDDADVIIADELRNVAARCGDRRRTEIRA